MLKKCCSIMLSVILLAGAFFSNSLIGEASQDTIIQSGECGLRGNNVIWQLDSNGLLTISGVGEMDDVMLRVENKENITDVVILEGVTNVGDYAFQGFSNMQSISLASSVKNIGNSAFQECSCLVDVNFPVDLESIGVA